jgi:hypothetical protein
MCLVFALLQKGFIFLLDNFPRRNAVQVPNLFLYLHKQQVIGEFHVYINATRWDRIHSGLARSIWRHLRTLLQIEMRPDETGLRWSSKTRAIFETWMWFDRIAYGSDLNAVFPPKRPKTSLENNVFHADFGLKIPNIYTIFFAHSSPWPKS